MWKCLELVLKPETLFQTFKKLWDWSCWHGDEHSKGASDNFPDSEFHVTSDDQRTFVTTRKQRRKSTRCLRSTGPGSHNLRVEDHYRSGGLVLQLRARDRGGWTVNAELYCTVLRLMKDVRRIVLIIVGIFASTRSGDALLHRYFNK